MRRRMAFLAVVVVAWTLAGCLSLALSTPASITTPPTTSTPTRQPSTPASTLGGLRWELTSATVLGMPGGRPAPNETESLYLYPNGTTMATGFCFTRQGRWQQMGTTLTFTDQRTLNHRCGVGMNDSVAPRFALLHLDGSMAFSIAVNVLRLSSDTTTMTLQVTGSATSNSTAPGRLQGSGVTALSGSVWQLLSARRAGRTVALPRDQPTTMNLYSDGTSTIVGPSCFYRTGRWHTVDGGFELTDQVGVSIACAATGDPTQVAGGTVITGLVGPLEATVRSTTLTVKHGVDTVGFVNVGRSAEK